jgi:hypothetical protein
MESFAGLVLRASRVMGAPFYLAKHLGVAPYDVYRWIAGMELPKDFHQKDFERRLLRLLEARADVRQIASTER